MRQYAAHKCEPVKYYALRNMYTMNICGKFSTYEAAYEAACKIMEALDRQYIMISEVFEESTIIRRFDDGL